MPLRLRSAGILSGLSWKAITRCCWWLYGLGLTALLAGVLALMALGLATETLLPGPGELAAACVDLSLTAMGVAGVLYHAAERRPGSTRF